VSILEGWDSHAWINGPWIHRSPRRPEVRARLLAEATLLPWLAPQLPLPVPVPEPTEDGVRHLMLIGDPIDRFTVELGRDLGSFLRALHAVDPGQAVAHAALDADAAAAEKAVFLADCRTRVLPLLPPAQRSKAADLLDRVGGARTALIHCDFGPDHILVADGRITGIIDWTDAQIGDPAVDLCWALDGATTAFRRGLVEVYESTDELVERARDWARLSPWYGVHRGLLLNLPADVENGLKDIVARL
jgi:aminoglycoside phosphotransferase (APT) family kinase protein